jgi:F-type H+-transporting ATPase subunit delta
MASGKKQVQQLARQLFKLSVVDGAVNAGQVAAALAYVEKHRPAHSLAVLHAYQRLVAAEIARGQAVVEHAGPITPATLAAIESSMTKKYGRKIATTTKPNDKLLAGFRVRVGDDVYESSVAGQLATLANAV